MDADWSIRRAINRLKGEDFLAMHAAWHEYETACRLSRGPDKGRSLHWAMKAREIENNLRLKLDIPR